MEPLTWGPVYEMGIPDLDVEHQQLFTGFQERVTELYSRYLGGDPSVGTELCAFLRAWIVAHIQGSDRRYIPYLRGVQAN